MKILVLTDRYPPYYEGGYEVNCFQISEALRARHHDVIVLTTTFGVKAKLIDDHVYRILSNKDIQSLGKWQRRFRDIKQIVALRQDYISTLEVAKKFKPDLAFIWHMSGTSLSAIFAVRDLGIPLIYRIGSRWLISQKEDYSIEGGLFKKIYRRALLGFRNFEDINFDLAIMVSESTRQNYQNAGFSVENSVVIPSGVPAQTIIKDKRIRDNLPLSPARILFAGRLEYEKGVDIVIQAIEYLVKNQGCEDVQFDFIGKGDELYVETLKQKLHGNNLIKYTRFLGFIRREELINQYKNYDISLFPSLSREGLPMTIIESMSQGVPVIASDIGGPNDIITNGKNGFLIPSGDAIALANAILVLVRSPELRDKISQAGIETVENNFAFEKMLDRYEKYLESCI